METKKLKIENKEKNQKSLNALLEPSPEQGTALKEDKYLVLKEQVEKIAQTTESIMGVMHNIDTQSDIKLFKEAQEKLLDCMQKEIISITGFREDLKKSVEKNEENLLQKVSQNATALLSTSTSTLEKAEQTFLETEKKSLDLLHKSFEEMQNAKIDLEKHAFRFANPTHYIRKQDVLFMFLTFILGGLLTWTVMSSFTGSIIDSHFQTAVQKEVQSILQEEKQN